MNKVGIANTDINGNNQLGTTIAQMFWNADTGIKSTTANAYIESKNLTNLHIVTRAFVYQILFINNSSVHGVMYKRNGSNYIAHTTGELIISAGAINTPQLLMLSGIGPTDHLNQLNITTVTNLPVGNNLHDHVFVPLYYRINNQSQIDPYPNFDVKNLYNYYANASGPLAHHPDGITYYNTRLSNNRTWPDTMIISVVEFFNDLNGTVAQYNQNK